MRTLYEVKTEISELINAQYDKPRQKAKAQNRIQFLKMVEAYIEGCPDEHFIASEISRLEKRSDLILSQVNFNRMTKEDKKEFENKWGLPLIRQQIKALRFIKK